MTLIEKLKARARIRPQRIVLPEGEDPRIVAAAAAILVHAPREAISMGWWIIYATLAVLFLICDSTATLLAARYSAWSPSSAATLAAVVLLGARGAAMVGVVAVLSTRRRVPLAER